MSNISNSTNPIQKPQDTIEQKTDLTLQEKESNHDFNRRNTFCWFVLAVSMIVITCITGLFLWRLFVDPVIQDYIINQIKGNIIFLIVTGLAILKINLPASRN